MLITVQDAATGLSIPVYIDVDRRLPLRSIVTALIPLSAADVTGATAAFDIDGRFFDEATPIGESSLADGSRVTLHTAFSTPRRVDRAPESSQVIRVVSGSGAGTAYHCREGLVTIGRGPAARIEVLDPDASEVDAGLLVASDGSVTLTRGDRSPAMRRDGAPAADGDTLRPGDQFAYADRVMEVGWIPVTTAAIEDDTASGVRRYNRPPRLLPHEPDPDFRLPRRPAPPEKTPLPLLLAVLPLGASVVMALLFRSPLYLVLGLLSPLMIVGSYLQNRRSGGKRYRKALAEHREHTTQIEGDAQAALQDERVRRKTIHPDPSVVAAIATGPSPRLWERRRSDGSWLALRLGTATLPSNVTLHDPNQLSHKQKVVWDIPHAPVVIGLAEAGVIGLAGAGASIVTARQLAQWLCAQIGVLHSPKDVQVFFLTSVLERTAPDRPHPWEFVAWLPHTAATGGVRAIRSIGSTATSLAARIAELGKIIDAREGERSAAGAGPYAGSSTVVVMERASRMRSMPGLVRILTDGPRVGVYSICVETDERLLAEECDVVVVADGTRACLGRQRQAERLDFLPDLVSPAWLDWTSRAIAPIVDSSPDEQESAIPSTSRLLDLLHLDPPTPEAIQAGWLLHPRSTTVVVGESLDGPFSLDLLADGPHTLVGGTTGSGKSEFLQTIVASLAVANSPQEMNFVLVDYKGGAAFKDCERLPHTVGMVTDLDSHLVARALTSLSAELRRREHLLAEAGAKDLEDYQDLASRHGLGPIPRLLVVVDEFASLVRELPDFVAGLVSLAQRGRSLGIHLLLATQRPSGAVSAEIRANTNLRIALRMTDSAESTDVIGAKDAATIPTSLPGRAYARLGATSLVPFQSARVGGRSPIAGDEVAEQPAPLVQPLWFPELGEAAPERRIDRGDGDVELTDLRVLVDVIQQAHSALELPEQRQPWLPPLDSRLALDTVLRLSQEEGRTGAIPLGLQDFPEEQERRILAIDPDDSGHLFVIGAAGSGKTNALRAIAVSAASSFPVSDLHIHALDCGNGGLLALDRHPHVGTVAQRHQTDRVLRLIRKLAALVRGRQSLLAEAGVSSVAELRRIGDPARRPAHTFLLLDGWEAFVDDFQNVAGGEAVDTITFLLREGMAAGLHLAIAGDRTLLNSGKIASLVDDKLLLRLVERSDYSSAGLRPRDLPDEIPDGRAFTAAAGVETQLALIAPGLDAHDRTAWIRSHGDEIATRDAHLPPHHRPFRVIDMPTSFRFDERQHGHAETEGGGLFLGLGGTDVEPVTVDPLAVSSFVVSGNARSGRSCTLLHLARRALARGCDLVVFSPRSGVLRALDGTPGVRAVVTGTELTEDALAPLFAHNGTPLLVVADDVHLLRDVEASRWLQAQVTHAAENGLGFIAAGNPTETMKGFSGWVKELTKSGQGVVLTPRDLLDGQPAGIALTRGDLVAAQDSPPGRGLTHGPGGGLVVVQIPHPHIPENGAPA